MARATDRDEHFMRMALACAVRGRPSPNPHVGAVVVRGGRVVGIGHHERAGLAHAEVVALERAGSRARGATLYVTMEPCNHFGRTPPCTDAIVRAGIARVVAGCEDPAPHVPGATQKLRAAGIEVRVGVLRERARALIEDFARHITTGLPWVTLKLATTLDGRIAARGGASRWITSEPARRWAHRLRARADAVLVGVGTVLADDPALDVRLVPGVDPRRVVLDTRLRTPPTARLLAPCASGPALVVHGPDPPRRRAAALRAAGAELVEVPLGPDGHVDVRAALAAIGARDVVRLLCEGGGRLAGALLDAGLVDELVLMIAPVLFGDERAVPLAAGRTVRSPAQGLRLDAVRVRRVGPDWVLTARPLRGGAPGL
ncbi:MAG: bifunctional diaminohydroxyphosphoribosylaminopyrimidine deaminase/5-amino-6-(5-phosphoribosylamino)uracil reductase RibD [Myxococcota bacterium]|nr:bifunctional diaminohydroxyphosphoribosylaminopyrimidine deaminase/5-amino-6-(5-phosphoribosylamino)uracil reductase RibD [Myxococcota bacterium]MDW8363559.1 bifunctional diaminohydroxyphosphoribosylaminopyrimidine deaminase/5-amino-6-(5-phosphoribosylamino)uracil reductase RibD [Myxococcales bacterium]